MWVVMAGVAGAVGAAQAHPILFSATDVVSVSNSTE
jgi:hypothetical protein